MNKNKFAEKLSEIFNTNPDNVHMLEDDRLAPGAAWAVVDGYEVFVCPGSTANNYDIVVRGVYMGDKDV